ncbi:Peptidase M16 [Theobroma cacao]|nr:Peptidase M16 [Theobroma cacao]
MAHVTEIDEEIVKPRTDKREYRRIVLGNSLQVLLICDPDTDKAMRMLPYSSEKYPWEDSFSEYISEHGGYTNSVLYAEWTSYFFDISNDCFEEALER